MFIHDTKIRVRYKDTDQMGRMHHANYAVFFEEARTEMLRSQGLTYKQMEEMGVMMPVLELKCKFLKPALYDEVLTVTTKVTQLPAVRMIFYYEVYNEQKILITTGETTLVFVDMKKNKPCIAPKVFMDKMIGHFT